MSTSGSPTHSLHNSASLDRLVAFFVAAKKSLSVTSHVYKANEIVEDARSFVEEGAILKAKNTYVRNGVEEQVHVLKNIHGGLEAVGLEAQVDFQTVIKQLDVANDRLQATLTSLRKTVVSSSLAQSLHRDLTDSNDEHERDREQGSGKEDKSLVDFIDEATHTDLLDSLRSTIDSYNDAQASLHKVRTQLGDSLQDITISLSDLDSLASPDEVRDPGQDDHVDPVPELFHALTSNATEMASLLQSLISHYDLCITALKHTEGGGEAAKVAAGATSDVAPLTSGADSPTEASLYAGGSHGEPISSAERDEMLNVLSNDAAQVEDVTLEIRDRAAEMGDVLSSLEAYTSVSRTCFDRLRSLLDRLGQLSTSLLPSCISSSTAFRATWVSLRTELVDKTTSLSDLASFYDSFLASYAALLREVERRGMVENKMKKITDRAMKDLEALQAEDLDMRRQFVKEVGEFLPRDIWPGLMDGPVRWEIRRKKKESGLGIDGA